MSRAPSGEQFSIAHGEQRATIVEVGGGVREYRHGDRAVLEPYGLASICDDAHGTVLAPWPNAWPTAATASTASTTSWR